MENFHQSNATDVIQNASGHSTSTCMLSSPPTSELQARKEIWCSRLSQNEQTRKIDESCNHSQTIMQEVSIKLILELRIHSPSIAHKNSAYCNKESTITKPLFVDPRAHIWLSWNFQALSGAWCISHTIPFHYFSSSAFYAPKWVGKIREEEKN